MKILHLRFSTDPWTVTTLGKFSLVYIWTTCERVLVVLLYFIRSDVFHIKTKYNRL